MPDEPASPLSDAVADLIAAYVEHPDSSHTEAVARLLERFPGQETEVRARLQALRALGIELEQTTTGGVPERLGDFRLIRPLGEGGMGVVYLAEQLSLGRQVALKLIRPEHLLFPRARERFEREVQAVASLQHPGVVPVYTVGDAEGIPYFAMERIRGCTLGRVLEGLAGRAPESIEGAEVAALVCAEAGVELEAGGRELYSGPWVEVTLRIAVQLAEALQHAHNAGIVHRDVKPSNIALTVDGRAMLFDFGLTSTDMREGDRLTRSGSVLGTLYYMAPEQVGGRGSVGPRTDVYALGVTLYEVLTLQLPFLGENRLEIERGILEGEPDSPRARNREVRVDAETVVLHAMESDPGRRYPSAADFARDLGHVLAHRPIEARPPGALVRARRYVERHPARTVAMVLGLGLVTILPTALLVQQLDHNRTIRKSRDELAETVVARDRALDRALLNESVQREMFDFMDGLFQAVDPRVARGSEPSVRELLDSGADRIDVEFAGEPEARARLRWSIGRVYYSLGHYDRAVALLEPAAELFRQVIETGATGRLSDDPEWGGRWLGIILHDLGMALTSAGAHERAREVLIDALETSRAVPGWSNDAGVLSSLGVVCVDMERNEEAAAFFEESLEASGGRGLPAAVTMINLATVLPKLGRKEEAGVLFERALELQRAELERDHPDLATALNSYAVFLKEAGRLNESRTAYEEAVGIMRRTLPADSDLLGTAIYNLGRLHDDMLDPKGALELYGEARQILSQRPPDHFQRLLCESNYANALLRLDFPEAALAIWNTILPRFEARWPDGHRFLADVHTTMAWALQALDRDEEADRHLRQADEIRAALAPDQ